MQIFETPTTNLWMLDISRDSLTRLTFDELIDRNPVWSPDGEWIYFSAFRGGASSNLYRKRSNGTGEAERLTESPHHQNPYSISPDGKTLAFEQVNPDTSCDIMLLRLDPEPQEPEVYLRTPFYESTPQFSNDGAWIAYVSAETGQTEIYVRPFTGSGGQVKVSSSGGFWPVWSPDGAELFYTDLKARKLMAVRFSVVDGEFVPVTARELIDLPRQYGTRVDVTGDPLRILTGEDVLPEGSSAPRPSVVVNWFDELEQKVPTP